MNASIPWRPVATGRHYDPLPQLVRQSVSFAQGPLAERSSARSCCSLARPPMTADEIVGVGLEAGEGLTTALPPLLRADVEPGATSVDAWSV